MQLTLWQFTKRINSTARPSGDGLVLDIKLKNNTSDMNPAFLLNRPREVILGYNYCLYNSRYYFITDVVSVTNQLTEVHASVDVLATFKGEISDYSCLVERSSSNYDLSLFDGLYLPANDSAVKTTTVSGYFDGWQETGCFIVRCIGKTVTDAATGISTWALTGFQLKMVIGYMFTDSNFDFLVDTSVKSFFNPFQYIVSVMWYPFDSGQFGNVIGDVTFGYWNSGVSGIVVQKSNLIKTLEITPPDGVYGDFRDTSESWTNIKLFLPGCGTMYINPLEANSKLRCVYGIDINTGECIVKVFNADTSYLIGTQSGKMATSVTIGQLYNDQMGKVSNVLNGLESAFSSLNPISWAFGGLDTALQLTRESAMPTPQINGSAGNMGAIVSNPLASCTRFQHSTSGSSPSTCGRMCMKHLTLGTLSGYVKCANASCPIGGYESEKTQLNNYLNGGFYYE